MISTIITSSVLIIVVIILRAIFHGKISSRLQYAIWVLVLIRALLPFSLLPNPVSVMNIIGASAEVSNTSMNPVNNFKNIRTTIYTQSSSTKVTTNKGDISETSSTLFKKYITAITDIVWLSGMIIISLWFIIINFRFKLKLRRSRKPYFVQNCKLPVYIVNDLPSPCLFGVFYPEIYLTPLAIKDEITLQHVLTHELTHYAHLDHVWALFRSIALTIHWFNPLFWISAKLSGRDCELACDEASIKKLGEENRIQYGRTLIGLIQVEPKPFDLFCTSTTMSLGKSEMKERITMITKKPKTLMFAALTVGIIIITAVLGTFTGAIKHTPLSDNKADIKTVKPITYVQKVTNEAIETEINTPEENFTKKLKLALPDNSIINSSYLDDFDNDGKSEMFSIVDEHQVWYTNDAGAKILFSVVNSSGVDSLGGMFQESTAVWDVGSRKLFYVEEIFLGSHSLSHVWSVKRGVPYELKNAGESLQYAGNSQFYTYPGTYDLKFNGAGHTWKRYYLYLDKATGTFKEYGGILISRKDLVKLKGASEILDKIDKKGYKITNIYYRQNGIININYKSSEYNLNITLSIKDGAVSVIEDLGTIESPNLDTSGIYKASAFKAISTYPMKFNF